MPPSAGQLVCKHGRAADVQRAFQQIPGTGPESLGDPASQMGLTARFIIERVENCEGVLVETDGVTTFLGLVKVGLKTRLPCSRSWDMPKPPRTTPR